MGRTRRARNKNTTRNVNLSHEPSFINLCQWLKKEGFEANPRLYLTTFPAIGRGLQAGEKINANDILVSIPLSVMLTREYVLNTDAQLAKVAFSSALSTQTLLSLWLLREREKGVKSSCLPYLRTLPHQYSNPYFCTADEIRHLPTYLKSKIMSQKKEVHSAKILVMKLMPHYSEFENFEEDFDWAWFTVNTRAVYLNKDPRYRKNNPSKTEDMLALAPFLDLLNHSFDVEVETGVNLENAKKSPVYQIRTLSSTTKHSQAFINYGPHDNTKLLVEYGFLFPNNPHEHVPICVEDFLDFFRSTLKEDIPLTERKLEILKDSGMDSNLSVTVEGVSWNTKVCLEILNMTDLSSWKIVYEDSYTFNQDIEAKFMIYVRDRLVGHLSEMEKINSNTERYSLCKTLVRKHGTIADEALKRT